MTRRDFTVGLIPALLPPRRAKAQDTAPLPFDRDIVRGNVTLRLHEESGTLLVMLSCSDKAVSVAIVTAFYWQKVRLGKGPEETKLLLSQIRVVPCVNPVVPCAADPFLFPVEALSFLRVETAVSARKFEVKPPLSQ